MLETNLDGPANKLLTLVRTQNIKCATLMHFPELQSEDLSLHIGAMGPFVVGQTTSFNVGS